MLPVKGKASKIDNQLNLLPGKYLQGYQKSKSNHFHFSFLSSTSAILIQKLMRSYAKFRQKKGAI